MKRPLIASLLLLLMIVPAAWAGSFNMNTDFYTPPKSQELLPLVKGNDVRNVILLIGDGMGLPQVTLAQYAGPGPDGRLYMQTMPVTGIANTVSEDQLITDSAAGVRSPRDVRQKMGRSTFCRTEHAHRTSHLWRTSRDWRQASPLPAESPMRLPPGSHRRCGNGVIRTVSLSIS